MENTVKQRLRNYIKYKNISERQFCIAIGASPSFVSNIVRSIQPDRVNSITKQYTDINTGWLLTGEGEMIKNEEKATAAKDNYAMIPLLPIAAQGGSLNDFVVSAQLADCEKIISPINGVDFAITVAGDSMQPEYPSGSQILIKKINERAFIEWGKVYVLDTCNGTVVKELHKAASDDRVDCFSLNPNPKYQPYSVAFADIYGIYRVMMCMSIK